MNEDIRKNAEINDDELEQTAGGCELHCENAVIGDKKWLNCDKCRSSRNVATTEHEYRGDDWYCTICNDPWHHLGGICSGH